MGRTGVVLLGFGGPDSLEAVGPFMCNLMGREPSEELVERVCRRYLTIGGSSPIVGIASEIAAGLESRLTEAGHDIPVRVGMRYWDPFIEDALAELVDLGCDRVITVSLSPFESKVTSGAYREAVAKAVAGLGDIEVIDAPLISEMPEFATFFAGAAAVALTDITPNEGAIVVFTAHSLPESDLVESDPYVAGLERVANEVATSLGLPEGAHGVGGSVLPGIEAFGSTSEPRAWFLVFQSRGDRPCEWLGPDLDSVIDAATGSEVSALVVCPIGFMTDHMETLYDLDVVAAERALSNDLEWQRTLVPNNDPVVLDGLCRVVSGLL